MTTSTDLHRQEARVTVPSALLRVSAIVFAAAYAVAMFVPSLPEGAYSDARVLSLLEGGDRTRIILGGYALVVAGCSLLLFAAALRSRLEAGPRTAWHGLIQMSAAVYAALLLIAAALFGSIPMGVALGELEAGDDPTLFRAMSNGGFHVLLVGGLGVASLLVLSTSFALRQLDGVPRWLPVLGFVVAPLLWLGFAWVPQFLVPVWAVATGVALGRRPDLGRR
jgi:hypothetical protein